MSGREAVCLVYGKLLGKLLNNAFGEEGNLCFGREALDIFCQWWRVTNEWLAGFVPVAELLNWVVITERFKSEMSHNRLFGRRRSFRGEHWNLIG